MILVGGVALASGGYLWGRSSSVEQPRAGGVSPERLPGLRSMIANAARARPAAVLPVNGVMPAGPSRATAERDADSFDSAEVFAELDPAEAEALSQAERLEYFDELSERIDGEARRPQASTAEEAANGAWRHATEVPLERLISEQLGSKVEVAEVTCASSFCRVQLVHPEWPRIPPDLMFGFDLARAALQVTEVQYDNRDEGATTLYFKRGAAPATQAALADPVLPDTAVANTALANTE